MVWGVDADGNAMTLDDPHRFPKSQLRNLGYRIELPNPDASQAQA
jgi:hypothetical protein